MSFDSVLAAVVWPLALQVLKRMQATTGCTAFSYDLVMSSLEDVADVAMPHALMAEATRGVERTWRMDHIVI